MLGVASSAVERSSGDPLANLERLIKESSEVQAGNFQLQHEMRAALAERNVMLRDLCEIVNKEKELVEVLADRCKKVEQQHTVMEWISKTLNQVVKDRTEKKSNMSEAESNITKHVALVDDLKEKFAKLQIESTEIQCQQDSISIDLRSVQSEVAKAIFSYNEILLNSQKYKVEFSQMVSSIEDKNAEINSLQQSVSDSFVEAFSSRVSVCKQIEDTELDSENLEELDTQLEVYNTQLIEVKARIMEFRKLIRSNDMIDAELLQMKYSISNCCKALEISNNSVLSALTEKERLTQNFLQSMEATVNLKKESDSLQGDIYHRSESQNDSIGTSEIYEEQIMSIMQELAEHESDINDKKKNLNHLTNQKQNLLQQHSQIKTDFFRTIGSQAIEQLESVRKLKQYNKKCRDVLLKLQAPNQWDQLRHDLADLANACSQHIDHDDDHDEDGEIETMAPQYELGTVQMCAEFYRLTSEVDELDLECFEILLKFQQLSEEYQSNMDELKSRIKEKNELSLQLAKCKTEAKQNKAKFAMMLDEKAAFYNNRIEEEQSSDKCDLGSIPKKLLDEMNNRKQQQARRFNERMSEIQLEIDATLNESQKIMCNSDHVKGCSTTRKKKLMPKQTTLDPWMLE